MGDPLQRRLDLLSIGPALECGRGREFVDDPADQRGRGAVDLPGTRLGQPQLVAGAQRVAAVDQPVEGRLDDLARHPQALGDVGQPRRPEHLALAVDLNQRPQQGDVGFTARLPGDAAQPDLRRVAHQPADRHLQDLLGRLGAGHAEALAEIGGRHRVHLAKRHLLAGTARRRTRRSRPGPRTGTPCRASRRRRRRSALPSPATVRAAPAVTPRRGAALRSAASAGPIRPARKLANSDPKIAAPNELPMVRKNVTPDVATPRSAKLAVFCTISTSTCMHSPIPEPRTNRYTDCCQVGVAASICGQQHERHRHDRGAGDRKDLVPAGAPDDVAAADRRDQHARHHRQGAQARRRRRDAVDELHERRQERQRARASRTRR